MALKILYADDSMTAQRLGVKILTEAGYEVVAVSNGAAAVKKLAEKPDLALLDIYMPGYSGLEVCQKIRAAAETAKMPVLLTVGKMEPFKPEDAGKAGADGVIIKPFEASDLLAAVQRIEDKLKPQPAAFEKTVKMQAMQEFQDESYQEWKTAAEEAQEGKQAASSVEMSSEAGGAPAFGLDMLDSGKMPAVEEHEVTAPAPSFEASSISGAGLEQEPVIIAESEPEPGFAAAVPLEPWTPSAAPAAPPATEPEIELTAAPQAEVTAEALPELEPTILQEQPAAPAAERDPGLITDATEMATAFPTKFGIEGAEPITVGVAADMPELYADAQIATEPPAEEAGPPTEDISAVAEAYAEQVGADEVEAVVLEEDSGAPVMAEEAVAEAVEPSAEQPVEIGDDTAKLVAEMQEAFADLPRAEEVHTEEAEEVALPVAAAPAPAAATENAPDLELAAAMAAAVGASAESVVASAMPQGPVTVGMDREMISRVVERVTDRIKAELIAEITRELEKGS